MFTVKEELVLLLWELFAELGWTKTKDILLEESEVKFLDAQRLRTAVVNGDWEHVELVLRRCRPHYFSTDDSWDRIGLSLHWHCCQEKAGQQGVTAAQLFEFHQAFEQQRSSQRQKELWQKNYAQQFEELLRMLRKGTVSRSPLDRAAFASELVIKLQSILQKYSIDNLNFFPQRRLLTLIEAGLVYEQRWYSRQVSDVTEKYTLKSMLQPCSLKVQTLNREDDAGRSGKKMKLEKSETLSEEPPSVIQPVLPPHHPSTRSMLFDLPCSEAPLQRSSAPFLPHSSPFELANFPLPFHPSLDPHPPPSPTHQASSSTSTDHQTHHPPPHRKRYRLCDSPSSPTSSRSLSQPMLPSTSTSSSRSPNLPEPTLPYPPQSSSDDGFFVVKPPSSLPPGSNNVGWITMSSHDRWMTEPACGIMFTNFGDAVILLNGDGKISMFRWTDIASTKIHATTDVEPVCVCPDQSGGSFMQLDSPISPQPHRYPAMAIAKNDAYVIAALGGKAALFNSHGPKYHRIEKFKLYNEDQYKGDHLPTYFAFAPIDNNICAVGLQSGEINVRNLKTRLTETTFRGHIPNPIIALSYAEAKSIPALQPYIGLTGSLVLLSASNRRVILDSSKAGFGKQFFGWHHDVPASAGQVLRGGTFIRPDGYALIVTTKLVYKISIVDGSCDPIEKQHPVPSSDADYVATSLSSDGTLLFVVLRTPSSQIVVVLNASMLTVERSVDLGKVPYEPFVTCLVSHPKLPSHIACGRSDGSAVLIDTILREA